MGRSSRPAGTADPGLVGAVPGDPGGDGAARSSTPGRWRSSRTSAGPASRTWASPGPAPPTVGLTRWPTGWSPTHATAPPSRSRSAAFSARIVGGDVAIAVTGADAEPRLDGKPFGLNSIHHAHDGQVISLGLTAHGRPQLPGRPRRHRRRADAGLPQLRRAVGDRSAAAAARRRAAHRRAHRRLPRTRPGARRSRRGRTRRPPGRAGPPRRLGHRSGRPGAHRLGGLGPQ